MSNGAMAAALREIKARKARIDQAQAVGNGQRYTMLDSDSLGVLIASNERELWWQMLCWWLIRQLPKREPKTLPFPAQARPVEQIARVH